MMPNLRGQHLIAPKVNPKVVNNQMIGYGQQKRASMRSMDEHGRDSSQAKYKEISVNHTVKHMHDCTSEKKRSNLNTITGSNKIMHTSGNIHGERVTRDGLVPANSYTLTRSPFQSNGANVSSKPLHIMYK